MSTFSTSGLEVQAGRNSRPSLNQCYRMDGELGSGVFSALESRWGPRTPYAEGRGTHGESLDKNLEAPGSSTACSRGAWS